MSAAAAPITSFLMRPGATTPQAEEKEQHMKRTSVIVAIAVAAGPLVLSGGGRSAASSLTPTPTSLLRATGTAG